MKCSAWSFKIVRLAHVPATRPWWTRPAGQVSDLTFSAAWIVGWWVLVLAGSRCLTRALVLVAAQQSTWAWSVLLVVYHEYWMRTGDTLTSTDWWRRGEGGTTCQTYRGVVGLAAALGLVATSTWTLPTTSARFGRAESTSLVAEQWKGRAAFGQVEVPASEPWAPTWIDGKPDRRNVVMIVLESQRATSTLPTTKRPVTPFLDELATHSLTAERAYVVTPHTSKSFTTIHCGVAPTLDTATLRHAFRPLLTTRCPLSVRPGDPAPTPPT